MIDTTATTPASNAYRVIQRDDKLAIHGVHVDDSGTVTAWDPEPVRLEVSADAGEAARWALQAMAFGSANSTYVMEPVLLCRDGQLIEIAVHGGDDAQPVRAAKIAVAA